MFTTSEVLGLFFQSSLVKERLTMFQYNFNIYDQHWPFNET